MSENGRWYYESKLAEKLSLVRDDVRYLRAELLEKEKGTWEQRGRDVVLSSVGLRALLTHLDVDPDTDFTDCLADPEKKESAVELTVKKLLPNRSLLIAFDPATEREVTVRVRDSSNFKPKMKLRAAPPQADAVGAKAFYQLEGRCPRYPGRY